jgi:hypothetical protein
MPSFSENSNSDFSLKTSYWRKYGKSSRVTGKRKTADLKKLTDLVFPLEETR